MKKIIALLFATILAAQVWAQTSFEVNNLQYTIIEGTTNVSVGTVSPLLPGDLDISSTVLYNGVTYTVTSIGNEAFRECHYLTSVKIPGTVTTIDDWAFYSCYELTSVTISEGVTSIGELAFAASTNIRQITIPSTVETIGKSAFSGCADLSQITIPSGIKYIGDYAFSGCSDIPQLTVPSSDDLSIGEDAFANVPKIYYAADPSATWGALENTASKFQIGNGVLYRYTGTDDHDNVIIPDGVTSIAEDAFDGCSDITSLFVPKSVTSIVDNVFSDCKNLTSITIESDADFSNAGLCFTYDGIKYQVQNKGEVEIVPVEFEQYDTGCRYASNYYSGDLVIPESITMGKNFAVKGIGHYAFAGNDGITSVTIPNSITTIGDDAFVSCGNLKSVTIGNSVKTIGNSAFNGCRNLETVNLGNSVTSIGNDAFRAASIKNIEIPSSVTTIGGWAFAECDDLETIEIPSSVETIGEYAFWGIQTITYSGTAEGSPWGAGRNTSNDFIIDENGVLIKYTGTDANDNVIIPDGVTSIGDYAFQSCSNLSSVTIPESVTVIGNYVFENCTHLTSVDIPNSVTEIGDWAFYNTGLKSITIPNSVTEIKEGTFRDCSALTSVTIPESVTVIGNYALYGCNNLSELIIPSSVETIGVQAFADVPNVYYADDKGFLYAYFQRTKLVKYTGNEKDVEIPTGVTSIADGAFANNSNVKSVTIPSSVISIGDNAFLGVETVYYADDNGFLYADREQHKQLTGYNGSDANVVIPNGVTTIGDGAFANNSTVKSVKIPNSVKTIGETAFLGIETIDYSGLAKGSPWGAGKNIATVFEIEANDSRLEGWNPVGVTPFYDENVILRNEYFDDPWFRRFDPPTWYAPSKTGDEEFEIIFEAKYDGNGTNGDGTGLLTFIQGRGFGYFVGDLKELCKQLGVEEVDAVWKLSNIVEQMIVDEYTGQPEDYEPNTLNNSRNLKFYPTSDWHTFSMKGYLGRHAMDSVDLQFELGEVAGDYSIRNFVFIVDGEVFKDYFCSDEFLSDINKQLAKGLKYDFSAGDKTAKVIGYNGTETSVDIPATVEVDGVTYSVTSIGEYAFQNCSAMTSISIPESVTTIENYAFQGCSGLQKAEFASIESLCAISYKDNPYYYYGSPLLMANHLYIKGIEDEITEFTIPESVTTINDYVFYGSQITTLIVPEGIEVGENAFYGIEGYVYPPGITSYPTHGYTIDQSRLEGWTYQNWREPYVSYDDCIIISKPGTISTWDCQFNPPAWINPGNKDDEFEISFDARFIGYGKGDITFIQGRQFVYYNDEEVPDLCVELGIDEALTSSWQLQMYVEQLIVEEFTGQTDEFEPSKPFRNVHLRPTSEWQTFTIRGLLGRNGQDSVDLSFEFGSISGEYDIRNFTFKVNDKVFASYFSNSEPEPLEQLQANDSRLEGWNPVNATPFYNENVILRNEYFGDTWSSRFDPPTWYAPSKTGDEEFEIIFEAKYDGNGTDGDETGHFTFVQGRGLGSYYDDEAIAMCDKLGIEYVESGWQLQYAVEQMIVDEFTGAGEDFVGGNLTRNVHFYPTSNWQTFSMKGHLGRHAKDSVDLQFEFGDIAGDYSIRNFVLIVDGEVFKDYFCSDEFLSDINKQLVKGLKYDFSAGDKTAKVIGYNGTETSVDIPATVEVDGENYRVTVIDNGAFKDNTSLAKVTIAKGIETIGAWAFSGCTGLSKVIVPSSVISIGKDAFAGVPAVNYADDKGSLYADFEHTQLVKYTGSEANITIPSTVVSIGENAFEDNTDLKSVQIPASVKEIGEGAFSGCTGIDNVNLPKTVESIGKNAFKGVKNLTYSGTADVSQCGAKNVIATTVEGDFVFADASKTKLIQYNGTGGNVEIPSTVESIGVQAFNGNESLTTLVIPNSVKTIEEGAFANCHNLTDVSGGDNLKTIAELAFRGCHHLKNITLPNSVETIGDDAFLYVKNVEYYGIADGEPWGALTVNGYPSGDYIYADREQTRLTAYVGNSKRAFIPEGVIYIGQMAFFESRNLSVVEIPSTVRNIGGMAFANCTNLTKANVPQSVSILGRSVFRDCPYVEIDIEFDSAPYSWSNKWDYTLEEKQIRWGNVAAPQPTPVAVSESAADLQVYAHGNAIVVENAADAIYVYDAMGRLICRDAINRVRAELQVNVAGIYIVKVGTTAKRVMVND